STVVRPHQRQLAAQGKIL
ncbi:unnamed protein product, partial [Fusarium fujikuroi]